jgi:hypothetical protein
MPTKPGFWKLNIMAGVGNKRNLSILPNRLGNPVWKFPNANFSYQQGKVDMIWQNHHGYHMIFISGFSFCFVNSCSGGWIFCSMKASILHCMGCVGLVWCIYSPLFCLRVRSSYIFTQFLLKDFCYLSLTKTDLGCVYTSSYTDSFSDWG